MTTDNNLNTDIMKVTPFFIDGERYTLQDFLDGVDKVIDMARESGEFEVIANTVRSMSSFNRTTGISLAKLLFNARILWLDSNYGDDDAFVSYMLEFSGVSRTTVERYIDAWTAVITAPVEVQQKLLAQPMKNLNALGSKISQGFEPDGDTWEELANTHNNASFRALLADSDENDTPRSNRLNIYLEENGDIVAWTGSGERIFVGFLNIKESQPGMPLDKAINRIVKNSGMLRK